MLATIAFVGADPDRLGRAYVVGTSCARSIQADISFPEIS